MENVKDLSIGIIHNSYLKKGGEDRVAESEYDLLKANHFKVHRLKFGNPKGKLRQLFAFTISPFNVFSFIECCKWLKQNKINVLHIHNWFFTASPSVIWAARYCKVPVVMTMHNYRMICPSGTLIFNGKPYFNSLTHGFPWLAVRDGVYRSSWMLTLNLAFTIWLNSKIGTWKLVKTYIVLTEHSKAVLNSSHLKSIAGKLTTKPNFVKGIKVANHSKRQDNFLFVGRLSDEKGIRVLLSAFKNSAHKLTIIGDGPLQNVVERFTMANANVTYLGFKNRETINNELQSCSALIFPSILYETFGLIMIEAFALSTPVIASYCGSATIIVKNGYNGLHFEQSNADDLKEKLNEWSAFDETTKQRYRENSYESYLKHYTPETNLTQLINIYRAIV